MNFARPHTSIRLTVVSVFVLATLCTAGIALGLQYYFSESLSRRAASDLYASTAESVATELAGIRQNNVNLLEVLARHRQLADPSLETRHLTTFLTVLRNNPLLYGIYVGREDGSFFELINLNASDSARDSLLALPTDRWVVVRVSGAGTQRQRQRQLQYLSDTLRVRATRTEDSVFDATGRPWYLNAIQSEQVETTAPYLFAQSGQPGRTLSRRIDQSQAVVAIDMTLNTLSGFLASKQVSRESDIYLYDKEGLVVASSTADQSLAQTIQLPDLDLSNEDRQYLQQQPTLVVSNETDWPPFDFAQEGKPRGYSVEFMQLLAGSLGLEVRFENGYSWHALMQRFGEGQIDLLHAVGPSSDAAAMGLISKPYTQLPFAVVTRAGHAPVDRLSQLAHRRVAIPTGWSIKPLVKQAFPDVQIIDAASTREAINRVRDGDAFAALDNEVILRYIITHHFIENIQLHPDVSLDLSQSPGTLHVIVQPGQARLLNLINRTIDAFGPTQWSALEKRWLAVDSAEHRIVTETVPAKALIEIAQAPEYWNSIRNITLNGQAYLAYVSAIDPEDGRSLNLGILTPQESVVAPFHDKVKLATLITAGALLVLLPLSWLFANPIVRPIKQLARENDKARQRKYNQVHRVDTHVTELDELSESMVKMVDAISSHEAAQRALMDSFIQVIAETIDDKSPYTGAHCERVPELALMLARAATDSDAPAFRSFKLHNDDEWREYRIAAWLHDCGKISVPEHIVDKGSKLETIYNRLHEIRMRFEVLSRDAEVHYWESRHAHPEREAELREALDNTQKALQEEFEFVAECNVGGEAFSEASHQRLREIAQRTWQRRFSDRIGLSPLEELRLTGNEPELPVAEHLLSDKPEQILPRPENTGYPPEFGIDMEIPPNLHNQGELYNLSIARGTLTPEDRFRINEHMIGTIRMLNSLPFPDDLKNVPRYASTHHETMRGDGYPRKLPGSALSIPERLLAIADVYEALTASDRPYKKAKTVSEAIQILYNMVLDEHLDRDCFELFLTSGVYQQYAQRFLEPDQIDSIDTRQFLRQP